MSGKEKDLQMPPWHCGGDLCGVALYGCTAGKNEVQLEVLHVNLSLFCNLEAWRVEGCVYGGGFRPLVLGCSGTHSHVCGESLRSFC